MVEIPLKFEQQIAEMRRVYDAYGLWHRSPTDGMIALRDNDDFFVSQTKTDKTTMDAGDFSLITNISPVTNEVIFAGAKIPTSDVEFFIALQQLPDFSYAAHFHHAETTRGSKFDTYDTGEVIEYGRFESAKKIVKAMHRIHRKALRLREHGWVFFGNNPNELEEFVSNELNISKILLKSKKL